MRLLRTPPPTRWLLVWIWLMVLSGWFAVPAQFCFSSFLPNVGFANWLQAYWFFLYPWEIGALIGWRFYRDGDSLFVWSRNHSGLAFCSLLVTSIASASSLALMVDAVRQGMIFSSLFFALRLYAFLLLRCSTVRFYDNDDS